MPWSRAPLALPSTSSPKKTINIWRRSCRRCSAVIGSRFVQNILEDFVPEKIAAAVLAEAGISGQTRANQVTAQQREIISRSLKDFRLDVKGPRPLAEAMVTAGGICLDEVDPRTMQSKLIKGLYFCGEVLDIDADTGGFNLQAAFSTGYLAGDSAATHG